MTRDEAMARATGLLKPEKLRRLRPMATQLAVEAKQLEMGAEETVRLVEDAWKSLERTATRNGGGA